MKEYILNFLKSNKNLILIVIFFAPFYLTLGCPIRFFFGISCPSCGLSRAVESLLFLNFSKAFYFHPMVYMLPVVLILYLLRKKLSPGAVKGFSISILVMLIAVYLIRLVGNSDIVYCRFEEGLIYKLLMNL